MNREEEEEEDDDVNDDDENVLVFKLVQAAYLKVLKININWSNVTNEDY